MKGYISCTGVMYVPQETASLMGLPNEVVVFDMEGEFMLSPDGTVEPMPTE
jgi:hypothetical protein